MSLARSLAAPIEPAAPRRSAFRLALGQARRFLSPIILVPLWQLAAQSGLISTRLLVLAKGRIAVAAEVPLPRPRRRGDPGFQVLRAALLAALGVSEDGGDATRRAA